jgi:hypothetical protein
MNNGMELMQGNSSTERSLASAEVGAVAAVARETAEVQAALTMARKFPRDESACYAKTIKAFQRPGVAQNARYTFPRGNKNVSGPSVDCARELARIWGNIDYGVRVVSSQGGEVQLEGYAWDLETGARAKAQDRFAKLIQKKIGGQPIWVEPDERDARELIFRRGAILVRNAILSIIPSDIVDAAQDASIDTMLKLEGGKLEKSREEAVRELVVAFDKLGVSVEMLSRRLGHEVALITPDEMVELRSIWKSIHDGNSKRSEHFEFSDPNKASEKANAATEVVKGLNTKK